MYTSHRRHLLSLWVCFTGKRHCIQQRARQQSRGWTRAGGTRYVASHVTFQDAFFASNVFYLRAKAETKGGDDSKGRFFFGADGAEGEDDPAVDLFAQAQAAEKEEEPEKEEAGGDDDEPEDDFEAAWDILELAKTTYTTMIGDESQLKLAATYVALADISLETGQWLFSSSAFSLSDFNAVRKIRPSDCRLPIYSWY